MDDLKQHGRTVMNKTGNPVMVADAVAMLTRQSLRSVRRVIVALSILRDAEGIQANDLINVLNLPTAVPDNGRLEMGDALEERMYRIHQHTVDPDLLHLLTHNHL